MREELSQRLGLSEARVQVISLFSFFSFYLSLPSRKHVEQFV